MGQPNRIKRVFGDVSSEIFAKLRKDFVNAGFIDMSEEFPGRGRNVVIEISYKISSGYIPLFCWVRTEQKLIIDFYDPNPGMSQETITQVYALLSKNNFKI